MNNKEIKVLPTNISKIEGNSVWCPTFQLIWNDLKNNIVKDNIVFIEDKDNVYADELNKEIFNDKMISDNYYYKNYGYMTLELKEQIEKDIKNKFSEKGDILDRFNFAKNGGQFWIVRRPYFLYSILVRNFKFKHPFDILSDNTFGIKSDSDKLLDDSIKILFCDDNSYAVKLLTTNSDEVILYKGELAKNFNDTFKLIVDKINEENFSYDDTITISNLNLDIERKYDEITNKTFYDIDGKSYVINDALQTIKFNFDNTGGKIKSEAGMNVRFTALIHGRHFDFTNNFVLFLKEKDREFPYFALNVFDIKSLKSAQKNWRLFILIL